MMESIGYDDMVRMLRSAAEAVRAQHEMLSKLDSAGGDGDHGTTMLRAMSNMEKVIAAASTPELKTLLHDVGWAILGVDGGATGPLLGAFFLAMAEAVGDRDALDARGVASLFAAGLKGVQEQTKARPGDKTMMDALLPAVEAMHAAAERGGDIQALLQRAAAAAAEGAAATAAMQARFGRARNLKEKSIGNQDPGATSVSLIFKGFKKGIDAHA